MSADPNAHWHRRLIEGKMPLMAFLTTIAISIGGLVEIVPMFTLAAGPDTSNEILPYTPLEVAGRDIYIREGCYVCHSQMVRPMRAETLRYGDWSRAAEYQWDRPFQLGSRRIGPDLHRIGGKYNDAWHVSHMENPRSMHKESIMPNYPWLLQWEVDPADVQASVTALSRLGTPYSEAILNDSTPALRAQAEALSARVKEQDSSRDVPWNKEVIALTAYLQRLGTDRDAAIAAAGSAQ